MYCSCKDAHKVCRRPRQAPPRRAGPVYGAAGGAGPDALGPALSRPKMPYSPPPPSFHGVPVLGAAQDRGKGCQMFEDTHKFYLLFSLFSGCFLFASVIKYHERSIRFYIFQIFLKFFQAKPGAPEMHNDAAHGAGNDSLRDVNRRKLAAMVMFGHSPNVPFMLQHLFAAVVYSIPRRRHPFFLRLSVPLFAPVDQFDQAAHFPAFQGRSSFLSRYLPCPAARQWRPRPAKNIVE